MTVVVGTAGHIDHGKTTLLRALTGIDADRLPEERRRGMTIDVGYAHLALPDGDELDFVDVPGHDRLVGNMLVGAGEIDAALLVVAADDGPRAQTLEHLGLLDALGIALGVAVVTKADLVGAERAAAVAGAVGALLERTSLAGSPVVTASAERGDGLVALRAALVELRDRVVATAAGRARPARLAVDRVFSVRGRGVVVTGSLRGGPIERGAELRLMPDDGLVRVREVQIHGRSVERAMRGRTALNVGGQGAALVQRGSVLAAGPDVVATDRLCVALVPPTEWGRGEGRREGRAASIPADGARLRLHLGTDQVDARVSRRGRDGVDLGNGAATAVLSLERPVAAAIGDRFVLRRPSPAATAAGGRVLDPAPVRGVARRRLSPVRLAVLAASVTAGGPDAVVRTLLDVHGALRIERIAEATGGGPLPEGILDAGRLALAPDVAAALASVGVREVAAHHAARPLETGIPLAVLREALGSVLRRSVSVDAADVHPAAAAFVDAMCIAGRLARTGDRIHEPGRATALPQAVVEAMERLETSLASASPPALADAARAAGCPPDGIRALEAAGRIVRLDDDLAFAASTFARLEATALDLASRGPLSPAAYRDAIGSSRRYVMAILEDLGRRGVLARTADGHVPGPQAPSRIGAGG
jgi:selenocysteine-specific elongation factor